MIAPTHFPALAERVRLQKELQPTLYGDVDFGARPYRLALEPGDESSLPAWVAPREPLLADERLVELMSTATMLGDVGADPYASLMATESFRGLIEMLRTACREGIDAVPGAPPELRVFIASMEATPSWVDMDLVREGARQSRIPQAFLAPFVIRGAFVATFMNTYAALPMALTGELGGRKAARRVHETASFFAGTALPGALERHGQGFEAAAMVRLMHSMVRYNALKRSGRWDLGVYGIPVPQVDQMPAGLINIYILAGQARRKGRTEFTEAERATVEFSRYRCFLLGLPEELLPTTLDDTLDLLHARAATLRDGFDDDTCGELVRATMNARLRPGTTPFDHAAEAVERSYSKVFFTRTFGRSRKDSGGRTGVRVTPADVVRVAATAPFVLGRVAAVTAASRVPVLRDIADSYAIRMLKKRLKTYGQPEFTSDATTYTPTVKQAVREVRTA